MFSILSYKSYLYSHIACSCDKNNLESIQRKNNFLFLCMKFGVCDTFMLSAVCFTILFKLLLLLFLCVTFFFFFILKSINEKKNKKKKQTKSAINHKATAKEKEQRKNIHL